MRAEYENVLDDHLGKIHFTYVIPGMNCYRRTGMSIWKLFMCLAARLQHLLMM